MYVVRHHLSLAPDRQPSLMAEVQSVHAQLQSTPGFRWAMVLRSEGDPSHIAAVALWLKREDAGNTGFPVTHYDVATARGAMTPASFAAFVDWHLDAAAAPGFVNRWNAAYHAIEDAIGSRLLQDMDDPTDYTGFHVATSAGALTEDVLSAAIKDDNGADIQPQTIECFEVVQLNEA